MCRMVAAATWSELGLWLDIGQGLGLGLGLGLGKQDGGERHLVPHAMVAVVAREHGEFGRQPQRHVV